MNYEALRRICWKLSKLYFKKSVKAFEDGRFKDALAMTSDSHQHLERFKMCQNKLCEIDMFKRDHYIQRNPFKSNEQYETLSNSISLQRLLCEAHRDLNNANKMFQNALEKNENVDMDAVYDALDLYK